MAKKIITGNNDGPGGRNETYKVNDRNIGRDRLVGQYENNPSNFPDHHLYERGGEKYLRDNPDPSKKDNVNK